ncbi:MAG: hypothetical protein J3Q66DRAFT_325366 [Benniella sp.]|nr:MAG: hypothetical protein J3Q66DRAFT_325366 [Benniella sp.]
MNNLVSYGSDTESDSEEPVSVIPPKQHLVATTNLITNQSTLYEPGTKNQSGRKDHDGDIPMTDPAKDGDDDFVSAALQDLQNFAEGIDSDTDMDMDASPTAPDPIVLDSEPQDTGIVADPTADGKESRTTKALESGSFSPPPPVELTPEQQLVFDAFLRDIDAIPLTTQDQSRPPVARPNSNDTVDHGLDELEWQKTQPVQSIYSRMHQLSLLPSPTIDQKDIESRLIEFAIRILDWEQGGMKPEYFMGEARAQAVAQQEATKRSLNNGQSEQDDDEDEDTHQDEDLPLPPYAGVVGEMLEYMYNVEQSAAPSGWKTVWEPKDNSYGFRHLVTATFSDTYPSTDVIDRLSSQASTTAAKL